MVCPRLIDQIGQLVIKTFVEKIEPLTTFSAHPGKKNRLVMAAQGAFKVGGKAVYPAHGVGEIIEIQSKVVAGKERQFYVLKIIENGMKIMVPVETASSTGLRAVISRDDANEVLDILKSTKVAVKTQPWNRRYREYMEKINGGSIFSIAEVLRDLQVIKLEKNLSFGERKILDTAKNLLVKELAVARDCKESEILLELKEIFES